MPYAFAYSVAKGLGSFAFNVCGFKRARTIDRISKAFPEKSRSEVVEIATKSLQNILLNAMEMIRAVKLDRKWMIDNVEEIEINSSKMKKYAAEGHGVVVMVPHMGNWYMAAWALARLGVPLFAIAARQRNPYINAWMERQYGKGLEVLTRGSAQTTREIVNRLHSGQVFAILPDLRSPTLDVNVPFLNATANVSHGGAMFAVASGAPIVVAAIRRERGHHTFDHLATLRPDPNAADHKAEARRLMAETMALLNEAVRKTPEQWYWFNKRWLLQPVEE